MKILFVISKYYPKVGGTPNCVRNVIKNISAQNDVEILTTMDKADDASESLVDEITVHKCISYSHISMKDLVSYKKMGLVKHMKALAAKIFYHFVKIEPIVLKKRFIRSIQRLNKKNKYDWVVAVGGDIVPARAVLESVGLNKTCFYQLDPYTTNLTLPQKKKKSRARLEGEIHSAFDLVVTTQMIQKETERFFSFNKNTVICNFPNIINRVGMPQNSEEIRCMFCGSMYAARNASKALEIMNTITENNRKIFFDFYIIGDSSAVKQAAQLNPNIVLFDPVSPDEIFDEMNKHQALVNIGNLVNNQIPSKIYDYISTGLPIVNFCSRSDCPTVDVLEKYPMTFNVFPEDDSHVISQKLEDFLNLNSAKREDYTLIRNNYIENTIEYVSEKITEKMQQIGEGLC